MAYIVTADSGYSELSIADIDYQSPDFSSISATSFNYSDISTSSFQRMWASGGGYVDAKHTEESRVDNKYKNISGSMVTSEGGTYDVFVTTLYVFSFTWNDYLYVMWLNASSSSDLENKLTNFHGIFPTSNTLYKNTVENAISQGVMAEESTWEDNTDPDYDPMENQGGSNADLGQIYSEDVDDGFLMPFEPWANETTADHNACRMMQPYLMDDAQYKNFGERMWDDPTDPNSFWETIFKTVMNGTIDPMNAIAGVLRLPIAPGNINHFSDASIVFLGGVRMDAVFGHWVKQRYVRMQYGLRLKEVFGTYYDYSQTSIELYLPYISTVQINASEVMDSTLRVTYIVDVLTGDLLATLNCNKTVYGKNLNSIIGRWKGNCAMMEIYSRANTQQHAQNIMNGAFGLASALGNGIGNVATGNVGGAFASGLNFAQTGLNMAMDQRIKTEKGGGLAGASGWFDIQVPYLIINRNVPLYPDNWRAIEGAEQHATFSVSSLTGFTKFDEIHVHIPGATDEERNEIENILKSGIIL